MNYLIEQREYSKNAIEDLVESNRSAKDTFNWMMGEEVKEELSSNDIQCEQAMKEIPKPSIYENKKYPTYFSKH